MYGSDGPGGDSGVPGGGSGGPGGDSGGPEGLIRSALGALGAPYKDLTCAVKATILGHMLASCWVHLGMV